MDEVLAAQLMDVVATQGSSSIEGEEAAGKGVAEWKNRSARVFDGGDVARLKGTYVPVMKKERMETVEVINARYAERKGLNVEELRARKAGGGEEDVDE